MTFDDIRGTRRAPRSGEVRRVPERLTLTIEEAARLLGIGRGLAYELARTSQLPVIRLGRRMVVPRAQLEAMLAARPREAGGES